MCPAPAWVLVKRPIARCSSAPGAVDSPHLPGRGEAPAGPGHCRAIAVAHLYFSRLATAGVISQAAGHGVCRGLSR